MKRWLPAVFVLTVVGDSVADVVPPIWIHHKSVTVVLEASEPFPDYAFFQVDVYRTVEVIKSGQTTVAHRTWGTTAREFTVSPGQPVRLTNKPGEHYYLCAVPRSRLRSGQSPDEAIQDRGDGFAKLDLDSLESWTAPSGEADVVFRYHLERQKDGGVAFVAGNERLGSSARPGSASAIGDRETRTRWIIAGVTAAVGIAALGLWWARRGRIKPSNPDNSPPAVG